MNAEVDCVAIEPRPKLVRAVEDDDRSDRLFSVCNNADDASVDADPSETHSVLKLVELIFARTCPLVPPTGKIAPATPPTFTSHDEYVPLPE